MRPEQPLSKTAYEIFGANRIKQTEQNPATQGTGVALVSSIEQMLIERSQPSREKRDTFLRLGKRVTVELFPYEDRPAYAAAPKDATGRPYLASIENVVVETDAKQKVTAREHLYVDHEYNVYTARTNATLSGQETTAVIPSSFDDVKRVIDVFDSQAQEGKDSGVKTKDRELREKQIGKFKDALNESPEFVEAVVGPFEEISEESKNESLSEFWNGSGKGISFLMGNRMVEVAYLKDVRSTQGRTIPDSPEMYEKLIIFLHPVDGFCIAQRLILSTSPDEKSSVKYSEFLEIRHKEANRERGTTSFALRGAREILNEIKTRTRSKSILGFSVEEPVDTEDQNDFLKDEVVNLVPRNAPIEDVVRVKSNRRLRTLGIKDPTLDLPYTPFDPRWN